MTVTLALAPEATEEGAEIDTLTGQRPRSGLVIQSAAASALCGKGKSATATKNTSNADFIMDFCENLELVMKVISRATVVWAGLESRLR